MMCVLGGCGLAEVGLGSTWVRQADDMVMVFVPSGEFEMGSTDGQRDERPVHTVALDSFWIDSTEVTNGQYQRCVEAGVCLLPWHVDSRTRDTYYDDSAYTEYPVVKVGWLDATHYCEWAGVRLPTEAEWEYAARGSEGRIYPWGDDEPDCEKANYWAGDEGCARDTAAVGSYPAGVSWCGAYDMAGNVWEWVADIYGEYPTERQVNPAGAAAGRYRVLRGGSWFNDAFSMRTANRDRDPAQTPYAEGRGFYSTGFRCARDAEEPE
jgi:serine/threonine-protein kinase